MVIKPYAIYIWVFLTSLDPSTWLAPMLHIEIHCTPNMKSWKETIGFLEGVLYKRKNQIKLKPVRSVVGCSMCCGRRESKPVGISRSCKVGPTCGAVASRFLLILTSYCCISIFDDGLFVLGTYCRSLKTIWVLCYETRWTSAESALDTRNLHRFGLH